jgi:hypothetical protein
MLIKCAFVGERNSDANKAVAAKFLLSRGLKFEGK